jgi:8-oxo-dGTP diphosphatase
MWYKFATTKEQLVNNGQLISAVVLLKKENNKTFVLLNERSAGKWEMPGGKVEPGESSENAAIREIKEETNIKIKPKKLIPIDVMMSEYKTDKKCNYYAYIVNKKDKIEVGSDAKKLEWFDVDNLPYMLWNGKDYVKKTLNIIENLYQPNKELFVFVDIDGVLNKNNQEHKRKYLDNIYNLKEIILPEKVKLLNKIVKKCNPTFVLSSYWRKFGSLYAFNELFRDLGFESNFECATEFEGIEHIDRWKQINKVLDEYEPKKYVILDDKSINEKGTFDNKNLIHINENTGLTKKDIEKAIDILRG